MKHESSYITVLWQAYTASPNTHHYFSVFSHVRCCRVCLPWLSTPCSVKLITIHFIIWINNWNEKLTPRVSVEISSKLTSSGAIRSLNSVLSFVWFELLFNIFFFLCSSSNKCSAFPSSMITLPQGNVGSPITWNVKRSSRTYSMYSCKNTTVFEPGNEINLGSHDKPA